MIIIIITYLHKWYIPLTEILDIYLTSIMI